MKRITFYLSLGMFFVFGGVLGFSLSHLLSKDSGLKFSEIRNHGNYKYTNPLLECDGGVWISQDTNLNTLRNSINDYLGLSTANNDITFASVYYRDLNTGPWFGINENEKFSPSSLIKVPVMMAYFKLAEAKPDVLNKTITNTIAYDYSKNQNYVPDQSIALNQSLTISELIRRMIVYSDNLAYELLLGHIDNKIIFAVFSDLDLVIHKANEIDPAGNTISVKDYASFFRILYNSSYLNADYSEKALQLLTNTTFKKGLVAPIPGNIEVAHKFGERQYENNGEKQLHDCGIIYLPRRPYLVCIMTRGKDFEKLAGVIRRVSQIIYEEVSLKNQ